MRREWASPLRTHFPSQPEDQAGPAANIQVQLFLKGSWVLLFLAVWEESPFLEPVEEEPWIPPESGEAAQLSVAAAHEPQGRGRRDGLGTTV